MLLDILFLFQTGSKTAGGKLSDVPVDAEKSQSVFDIVTGGGVLSIIILTLMLFALVAAIWIFVERYVVISRIAEVDDNFMNSVRMNIKTGNIAAAKAMCQSTNSPIAKMIEKGIARIGQPSEDIERAMEAVGRVEVFNMEKGVGYLSLIAKLAPMFGFVGTIIGVINIFHAIGVSGELEIGKISNGLYTKMISSAGGLVVGIVAFFGYHILTLMIEKVVVKLERISIEFMDLLHEPGA
jgi:biopolymer transport protein ExbB